MNINKAAKLFLEHCRYEKGLSKKTLEAYKTDLIQFEEFFSATIKNIEDIDKTAIKSYLQELSKFEIRTKKRKIASSKALLNFLEFEDYILVNPFRKIKIRLKEPQQLPVILDLTEIIQLLSLLQQRKNQFKHKAGTRYTESLRDLAILEMLFSTGIRVSELCGLKDSDVNMESGNMLVRGKGNKERIVRISNKEALNAIMEYRTINKSRIQDTSTFFLSRLNKPMTQQSIRSLISKYCTQCKIRKKVTPHTFRHTFATLLLEQNVDIKYIQHMLGHSSINTTQIYTHVSRKKILDILDTRHPRHQFALSHP